jgi:predicted transposase/invertase (TIGR01784 family)
MRLLDPTLDIVFKLLFTDPRNERLLISLLTAVLQPESSIKTVTILESELGRDQVDDKGVVVDLLAELDSGRRVNIEMQCDPRGASHERWLYHWARVYAKGIKRGGAYEDLLPVACIALLDTSPNGRFHDVYRIVEASNGASFSEHFEIHVVELPQLAHASATDVMLRRWARFFRARTSNELDSLAAEEPIMAEAKTALEMISAEPSAQALAEMRERARILTRLRDKEAREEGRREGLRSSILVLARAVGLDPEPLESELESADAARLEAILRHLAERRAWPER